LQYPLRHVTLHAPLAPLDFEKYVRTLI
jgi:hypothetical protein